LLDNGLQNSAAASAWHMDIEQNDIRLSFDDHFNGRPDLISLTNYLDLIAELGACSRANQGMIID
jgi:hypothetical protein